VGKELAANLPEKMADRVHLQQGFMNLMLNAIEAMKDSGGELLVKSRRQEGQLQFSGSDTGGVANGENGTDRFCVLYDQAAGQWHGLGHQPFHCESHGSRLWATANDGRGATLHFTLPSQVSETSPSV
jgi:signal transduction histidine kinase